MKFWGLIGVNVALMSATCGLAATQGQITLEKVNRRFNMAIKLPQNTEVKYRRGF